MKKSLFTLIVLSLCSLLTAQFIVWRNGQIVYQSEINEVDSITLYEYNLPDTPEEPDSEPSFSLKYGDKEIQDGDVIDVTMDNYAWGELVAHLFLTNNADSEKTFTAKEVRNYDYTKYLSAFCVSACLVGNGEKEQLWSIGELAPGAEQELAMHLVVASWVDGEQIFQETATCPGVFTISNGEESITFTLNFVYVNENDKNKPAYVETDQVYLLGNCKKSDMSASVFGYGDGELHTFGGASLLPVDKLLEAGYYIVGVRVYIGNEVESGKVFVGKDYKNPEMEKMFTYKKGGWQYVLFDEPYDFQDDTYIGFTAAGTTDFLACEGSNKSSKTEMINIDGIWDLVSNQLGNYVFAIQAIIAGGDYSSETQHDVVLERAKASRHLKEGDDVVLTCELRCAGIVPTENVTVKCTLGGETKTVNVSEKLMNGQSIVVNFEGFKAPSVEKALESVTVEFEADYSNDVLSTNNRSEATLCVYTSESVERNAILVEQFTGQNCPNCPGGAKVMTAAIAGLEDPSKVVWVAHHTYYVDQFSLDESADIAGALGANFAPACNIDRMPVEYAPGTAELIWHPGYATTDLLEELIKTPGLATVELNRTYNAETRELTVEVKGNSLMDVAYLTVIVKQSGMKARQSGVAGTYEHNNAPRAFLSASKGDVLTLDNGNYTKTYTYTIPEKVGEFDCVLEDMEIVAFVHGDISKDAERMVYNADQVSVIAESNNNCSIYRAQYGIDEAGSIYIFELLTNDIEINADATSISGSGDYLVIMMYATPQEDGYPVAKEYPVIPLEDITEEDTECVIGGTVIQGQPIGTFAYVIEDGQAVDGLSCVGGSVKFEGNATNGTMTANFEFMNTQGETVERTYIYSGKIDLEQMQMNAPARALKFNHKKFAVPFTSNK